MPLSLPSPALRILRSAALALALPALGMAGMTLDPGEGPLQAKVKVAYVFNCLKFVDWPTTESEAAAPIRIGVVGTDEVAELLKDLSGRQARGRSLQVEVYAPESGRPFTGHLLYIARSEQHRLPQLLGRLGSGVLTVSDIPSFPGMGGIIGFVVEGDRIRLEVNLPAARHSSLKISAKLLEVARVIQ